MRFYEIKIYQAGSAPSPSTLIRTFTSHPSIGGRNVNDPGALNIVLDAYVVQSGQIAQQAALQIWGPSITDLMQAQNFSECPIEVYAGFQAGLPLNNQNQAGMILSGVVVQSFGNWQGTDMTLDFVISSDGFLASQNNNIVLNWLAGTQLSVALRSCLEIAFPDAVVTINISDRLVLNYDCVGSYPSLKPFAQTMKALTAPIVGGTYPGISVVFHCGAITVSDGTAAAPPIKAIKFQDFIGQPTWIDKLTMQFVCPLRADLAVGDYLEFPQGLVGGTANSGYGLPGAVVTTTGTTPAYRQQSLFKGKFVVISVHHMGEFRNPDGQAWLTVFNATPAAIQ